jgi:hypothetical protein
MANNEATRKLALLLRNDPRVTCVRILLRYFDDDELSEALRMNEHVSHIQLNFYDLTSITNWDSLLRVLSTREILENVALQMRSIYRTEGETELVTPFLLAIQQNPSMLNVEFNALLLSGDAMASFIDSAPSLTELSIRTCDMVAPGGVLAVAAALRRNTNIQRLKLVWLDEMYVIPIVRSLTSNTTVKTLYLDVESVSLDASLAVGSLLEATTTIQRLELRLHQCIEMDTFHPIAQGLIQSASVTDITLKTCRFYDQEVQIVNSIFESKSNLQSLSLKHCTVYQDDSREECRAAILSLLQPQSLLRSFELFNSAVSANSVFDTSNDFARLMTAVESSPLERFTVETIDSRELCLALIASIPKMQVGTLQFAIQGSLQDLKGVIMGAIKRNSSLRIVVAKLRGDRHAWLDDHDKMKLIAYSARNEFLAQWRVNPNVVPNAAWPEYLAAARTAGPDMVFSILRVLTPFLWNIEDE